MSFIIACPHCSQYIEILELNCTIFRCGILKETGMQIDPHASKQECDRLFSKNLIYGCGKPFKVINKYSNPEICEYI